MKAVWNGVVIAQSDDVVELEGNIYFPMDAVTSGVLEPSDTVTRCFWKGEARYYSVVVNGERLADAAWYYPHPNTEAGDIAGRIAFWKGVEVI